MSNKNYLAGRREEYACQRRWEALGYTTSRSAGSHGPWDVVAVKNHRSVELIQCKVVERESAAKKLIKDFIANPPFYASERFHQVLEVKIKGSSNILSVTV